RNNESLRGVNHISNDYKGVNDRDIFIRNNSTLRGVNNLSNDYKGVNDRDIFCRNNSTLRSVNHISNNNTVNLPFIGIYTYKLHNTAVLGINIYKNMIVTCSDDHTIAITYSKGNSNEDYCSNKGISNRDINNSNINNKDINTKDINKDITDNINTKDTNNTIDSKDISNINVLDETDKIISYNLKYIAHSGRVLCVYTVDKYILSVGSDRYVRVWRIEDLSFVKQIKWYSDSVCRMYGYKESECGEEVIKVILFGTGIENIDINIIDEDI
ncbi:hypothetical protein CWI38_1313p0010, partial [Hamiltosporidium tvaerminnensis]